MSDEIDYVEVQEVGKVFLIPRELRDRSFNSTGEFTGTYSDEDAIYVIAVRSAGPKHAEALQAALQSVGAFAEVVCPPEVVCHPATATQEVYDGLRALGFTFDAANRTVGRIPLRS